MRYRALAADYDGTLAHDGGLDEHTAGALGRLKGSGRRLIMVTGRDLGELLRVCPKVGLFDLVVAENGGLLYDPDSGETTVLADPPPESFIDRLRSRGVSSLAVGRVVVATWEPHLDAVRETIAELGLSHRIILNKKAVMILPEGVDKASGLLRALDRLGIDPAEVVSVGDAENDLAMIRATGFGVAVGNAIELLKAEADWTTDGHRGDGVRQLIDRWLVDGRFVG